MLQQQNPTSHHTLADILYKFVPGLLLASTSFCSFDWVEVVCELIYPACQIYNKKAKFPPDAAMRGPVKGLAKSLGLNLCIPLP